MFQVETVDDCSGIPRNVIEHATPAVFPNCRDTRTKETKSVRICCASTTITINILCKRTTRDLILLYVSSHI